ncbi:GGDEF domain-containing protein [Leucobacter allii]|uniref:GGDEF domain-containing protein n=1 Tax=Leucobacter allii TaxID=2932247 RepID=A0ABY4FGE6_9MICO|nr:GGDEF domain-containing protein [Leucobacter allii]UOQ55750.1 GGDEF domain-containing protein [Leucobacter allii]
MSEGVAAVNGAEAFARSAEQVVAYLNAHTPLTDWSVSRVAHGEQIHVHVHHDRILNVGDRVSWNESFCSRMSAGAAHVVRDSRADPDYADLEVSERVGSYAGYAISDDDGAFFGVLCGVREAPLAADETVDEELVRLLSELLSSQLRLSRGIDRGRRSAEIAEALAHSDALTGVLNRRGWDRLVADAQERVDAFGDPVAVAVVDLDGLKAVNDTEGHRAGDALIARAAATLSGACAAAHRIARIGGDEFAILASGVVSSELDSGFAGFRAALRRAGVAASIGCAAAIPGVTSVEDAIAAADRAMYASKRAHRGAGAR